MFTNVKLISYFLAPVNYFRMLLHEIFYFAIFFIGIDQLLFRNFY